MSVLAAATDLPNRPEGLSEVETITLIAALRSVPDLRKARGRGHPKRVVLSVDGQVVRGSRTAEGTVTASFGVFEQCGTDSSSSSR